MNVIALPDRPKSADYQATRMYPYVFVSHTLLTMPYFQWSVVTVPPCFRSGDLLRGRESAYRYIIEGVVLVISHATSAFPQAGRAARMRRRLHPGKLCGSRHLQKVHVGAKCLHDRSFQTRVGNDAICLFLHHRLSGTSTLFFPSL